MWEKEHYGDYDYWDDYDDYHYRNSSSKENTEPNKLYLIF